MKFFFFSMCHHLFFTSTNLPFSPIILLCKNLT